jgi:hypothetical protein
MQIFVPKCLLGNMNSINVKSLEKACWFVLWNKKFTQLGYFFLPRFDCFFFNTYLILLAFFEESSRNDQKKKWNCQTDINWDFIVGFEPRPL